jgi:dTDP-4-amino-4,6-dideoxygalactose transaminase
MNRLEARIGALFGYGHTVLFGRARAGLAAVLDAVGARGKPVIFPSNICPAVVAAIAAAGARPVAAPVSPISGLADDERLADAMAAEPVPGIVMPTHLYGLWAAYPRCRAAGWFVLENDTLCAAALRDGRRRAMGDALLVSFNHVKTIEAGIGGAVLTDAPVLAAELARLAESWPPLSADDEAVEEHLTLARRHLRALGRGHLAEHLLEVDAAHTRHSLPENGRERIAAAMDMAPAAIARRWERIRLWEEALARFSEELCAPAAELSVPWRLTLRLRRPERRDPLAARLRAAGFDAGTNFPPLAQGFPAILPRQPDAERWGQAVLNLWLSDDYDAARISAAAAVVQDFFEKVAT